MPKFIYRGVKIKVSFSNIALKVFSARAKWRKHLVETEGDTIDDALEKAKREIDFRIETGLNGKQYCRALEVIDRVTGEYDDIPF